MEASHRYSWRLKHVGVHSVLIRLKRVFADVARDASWLHLSHDDLEEVVMGDIVMVALEEMVGDSVLVLGEIREKSQQGILPSSAQGSPKGEMVHPVSQVH